VKQNGVAPHRRNVKEPTLLYLVRHCQSSGQAPDAPLTPLGHEQAEQVATSLRARGIARIVSSPYLRAVQTVEPLASQLGLSIETDVRLIERNLSPERLDDWIDRLRAAWADHDLALPGGESSRQATARGMAAIEAIVDDGRTPTVVVSHGNLISLLLHAFDGRPGFETWQALTNPDLFEVVRTTSPDAWTVTRTWMP
jgi:2,3-bisphosphoglycerate-dependent phosphoglycerate mutase